MRKTCIGVVMLCLLAAGMVYAQVDTAWVRRYNGPGDSLDQANGIAVDAAGNVYVTGSSYSSVSGTGDDFATIKYNSAGVEQWVARYNGPGKRTDYAYAIAVDAGGNVYVTGNSVGGTSGYDYATIKYKPDGDTAWVRRYDGPAKNSDYASAIAVDADGNVYVTGTSFAGTGYDFDYATVKYDNDGSEQWVARYNGPGNSTDQATAIGVDAAGNVYVTGKSGGGTGYGDDYVTIKYKPDGDTAWVRRYDGAGWTDQARAIALDAGGNVCVTGYSRTANVATAADYATIKYKPNGDTAWVRRYDGLNLGTSADYADAIAVDAAGNVCVTGYSEGSGTGTDYATIKYKPNGDTAWVRRYSGPGNDADYASAIAVDAAGNVCVTGYSEGSGTGTDYATIKYKPNGDTAWLHRYDRANYTDRARAVAVDHAGNVYVTGYSCSGTAITTADIVTIKYNPITGVVEQPTQDASRTTLGATIIRSILVLPEASGDGRKASSVLLDITGRTAARLAPGPNDVSGLAPGVYFYVGSATGDRLERVVIATK